MSINKNKIGILTFHKAASFGAVLQCYALYTTLKKLFPENEVGVIDLVPKKEKKKARKKEKLKEKFYDFINKNIRMLTTEKNTLGECLKNLIDPATEITDIIVGSDQVWNPAITKSNFHDYFAVNIPDNVRKHAYAASFGTYPLQADTQTKQIITKSLAQYNAIGVREQSAVEICRQLGRKDAVNVLDPTLLADAEIFNRFIKKSPESAIVSGFFLAQAPYQPQILKTLAKAMNTQAVYAGIRAPFWSFIKSDMLGAVEDFVSIIHNSAGIVTDSFHGVCFSIIFRKQFIVLPSHKKERFVRIAELLKKFNLEDRIIYSYDPIEARNIMLKPIDYSTIAPLYEEERIRSLNFLKSILSKKE